MNSLKNSSSSEGRNFERGKDNPHSDFMQANKSGFPAADVVARIQSSPSSPRSTVGSPTPTQQLVRTGTASNLCHLCIHIPYPASPTFRHQSPKSYQSLSRHELSGSRYLADEDGMLLSPSSQPRSAHCDGCCCFIIDENIGGASLSSANDHVRGVQTSELAVDGRGHFIEVALDGVQRDVVVENKVQHSMNENAQGMLSPVGKTKDNMINAKTQGRDISQNFKGTSKSISKYGDNTGSGSDNARTVPKQQTNSAKESSAGENAFKKKQSKSPKDWDETPPQLRPSSGRELDERTIEGRWTETDQLSYSRENWRSPWYEAAWQESAYRRAINSRQFNPYATIRSRSETRWEHRLRSSDSDSSGKGHFGDTVDNVSAAYVRPTSTDAERLSRLDKSNRFAGKQFDSMDGESCQTAELARDHPPTTSNVMMAYNLQEVKRKWELLDESQKKQGTKNNDRHIRYAVDSEHVEPSNRESRQTKREIGSLGKARSSWTQNPSSANISSLQRGLPRWRPALNDQWWIDSKQFGHNERAVEADQQKKTGIKPRGQIAATRTSDSSQPSWQKDWIGKRRQSTENETSNVDSTRSSVNDNWADNQSSSQKLHGSPTNTDGNFLRRADFGSQPTASNKPVSLRQQQPSTPTQENGNANISKVRLMNTDRNYWDQSSTPSTTKPLPKDVGKQNPKNDRTIALVNKKLGVTVSAAETVTDYVIPPAPPIDSLINRQMSRSTSTVDGLIGCAESETLASAPVTSTTTKISTAVLTTNSGTNNDSSGDPSEPDNDCNNNDDPNFLIDRETNEHQKKLVREIKQIFNSRRNSSSNTSLDQLSQQQTLPQLVNDDVRQQPDDQSDKHNGDSLPYQSTSGPLSSSSGGQYHVTSSHVTPVVKQSSHFDSNNNLASHAPTANLRTPKSFYDELLKTQRPSFDSDGKVAPTSGERWHENDSSGSFPSLSTSSSFSGNTSIQADFLHGPNADQSVQGRLPRGNSSTSSTTTPPNAAETGVRLTRQRRVSDDDMATRL